MSEQRVSQRLVAAPQLMPIPGPLHLACGRSLGQYRLNFETYGTLAPERDNVILVCHSLTKNAHAAGGHAGQDDRTGWWDGVIGPGKALDTEKFFVVSSDALGTGRSTSPSSVDPRTGRPYATGFPVVTVADMVAAQRRLLARLGIDQLHAVIGGCVGGQQAMQWAVMYPRLVRNAVVISTAPATSAHTIAIFAMMRRLIRADPKWNGGHYYGTGTPAGGLGAAVAAALPLWMSRESMQRRFGRRLRAGQGYSYTLDDDFLVESFMEEVVSNARYDMDANSLMYMMRATEYFDLEHDYGSIAAAAARMRARSLFVSYATDWRYPPEELDWVHRALTAAGGNSRHVVLDSHFGHGAFMYDAASLTGEVASFLADDWQPAP